MSGLLRDRTNVSVSGVEPYLPANVRRLALEKFGTWKALGQRMHEIDKGTAATSHERAVRRIIAGDGYYSGTLDVLAEALELPVYELHRPASVVIPEKTREDLAEEVRQTRAARGQAGRKER